MRQTYPMQVLCHTCNNIAGEPPHIQYADEPDEKRLCQEAVTNRALMAENALLKSEIACLKVLMPVVVLGKEAEKAFMI